MNNIPPKPAPSPLRRLFLLDSLGALLSAFMLGVVLVRFEQVFGMPPKVLYPLASIAGLFCVYSCLGFAGRLGRRAPHLARIAGANLAYCVLTLGLLAYWLPSLTAWGVAYFVAEVAIVAVLAAVELRAAWGLDSEHNL